MNGDTSGVSKLKLPDVWRDDPPSTKAIEKNRILHPAAKPIQVLQPCDGVTSPRVGLVIDSDRGTMAAHQPFPKAMWDDAAKAGVLTKSPGSLSSFGAAASANERPERITAAVDFLRRTGLVKRCVQIVGRRATTDEINLVHTLEYIEDMAACMTCDDPIRILKVSSAYNTVFMNQHSVNAAMYAAGSTIQATQSVIKGEIDCAVCVVRPPGHHAECKCGMGYGIFNSVAAAAADAVHRQGLERVMIVDWDIHHGNGTQDAFAGDNRVLYFSAHGLVLFPAFARDAQLELQSPSFVGLPPLGIGFSCNCAWTETGYGDAEYAALWKHLLLPVALEYEPQLVIVSAGFDSAAGDEEGYLVSPEGYAYLLSQLTKLAGGRVVVVLEGGYNIPAISHGLHACTATLLQAVDELPSEEAFGRPAEQAWADITAAIGALRPHWKCLQR